MNTSDRQALYLIADELRGMATIGRHFANNPYEVERAHRINELAATIAALAEQERTKEEVQSLFNEEPWHRISPAIGTDAAVFDEKGRILLIKRAQDQTWAMPGGLSEIGHTPAQGALKELWEEAGLKGCVVRLLGVFDGPKWGSLAKVHHINMIFHVQCDDLTPKLGIEATDWAYYGPDELPSPMHPSHRLRVPKAFELIQTEQTYYDPVCSEDITLSMVQRRGE